MKTLAPKYSKSYFPTKAIAHAMSVSQKTVRNRADQESWPKRSFGYRIEFRVPRRLQRSCQASAPIPSILFQPRLIRELKRGTVVLGFVLEMERNPQRGVEWALQATVKDFQHLLRFSVSALRRWVSGVAQKGLLALQERKAGRVGRKSFRLAKMLK